MVFAIQLNSGCLLYCSELKVKHYKEILKCTYGDDIDNHSFVQTMVNALCSVIEKPKDFFLKEITIFDFLYLVVEIRNQSLGNEIGLTLKDKKAVTFNLQILLQELKRFNKEYQSIFVEEENIGLQFALPSINRLLENTETDMHRFLKSVVFETKDGKNITTIETNKEAKKILDNISAKLLIKFEKTFEDFYSKLNETDILKRYKVDTALKFIPTIEDLIWFTKLIFNEQLDVFYNNVFYLAKLANFNPEYIEECAPGEYIYFIKQLEASLANAESSDSHQDLDQNDLDSEMP